MSGFSLGKVGKSLLLALSVVPFTAFFLVLGMVL